GRGKHNFSRTLIASQLTTMLIESFFFSSRRRHTRCLSDWSSDVCSSDLEDQVAVVGAAIAAEDHVALILFDVIRETNTRLHLVRSEERRVGKECRSRWWADY